MSPDPRLSELLTSWRTDVAHWRSSHPGERDAQADDREDCADELAAVLLGGTPQHNQARRVPEAFSLGSDRTNAQKAWLAGYDAASGGIASSPRPSVVEWQPTLQNLAADLGLGALTATEVHKFLYEREQMLRMVQAELETHKSNAPTAWLALKDRIQSLRADASPTWQPIETAPKDGTWVLITGCNAAHFVLVAAYREWNGCWVSYGEVRLIQPTHWMPVPAAPETYKNKEKV